MREYLTDFFTHPLNLAITTASICLVLGYVGWSRRKRWVKVGKVGKLYIFPLKSGAVMESNQMYFQSMGPRYSNIKEMGSNHVVPRLGDMIDRGFAVVNAGSQTIRDTHSFPRLCLVTLTVKSLQVQLSSPDANSDLVFSLPADFEKEPKSRLNE